MNNQAIEKNENENKDIEMENCNRTKVSSKKEAMIKEVFSWIRVIGISIVISLLFRNVIFVNASIPTGSMENTIMTGDRLMGYRLAYLNSEPQRGDIIIFKYPLDEEQLFVKRVIGLPGEMVDIKNSKIYINQQEIPLAESYLKEDWYKTNDDLHYVVPQGYYFVLGDNRNISLDGRLWCEEAVRIGLASTQEEAYYNNYCFVSEQKILGKAIMTYYPRIEIVDAE